MLSLSGSQSLSMKKALEGELRNSDYHRAYTGDMNTSMVDSSLFEANVDRTFMTEAYESNDWIRAIVDAKCERVSQVDFFPMPLNAKYSEGKPELDKKTKKHMEEVASLILQPNTDAESFSDLIKKVCRDVDVYDMAGLQITRSSKYSQSKKVPYGLYANVSGEELYVNPKKDGTLPNKNTYLQLRNGKTIGAWDKTDMMRCSRVTRAGYANGLSPIATIAASILGDFEMMNYNLKFFENNARPNIAFIFENLGFGKTQSSLENARNWYNLNHKANPHKPLFMGSQKGSIKLHELTATHKDMDFEKLQLLLLSRIMSVYGMQPMVLGILTDTTGKLNSEVQTEQFKKSAIIPMVKLILNSLNNILIWNDANFGYKDIYIASSELDIEDDKKQAEIEEIFLDRGVVTINQVRARLQMPPVPWGDEPFVPLNYSPLSTLAEYQQAKIESMRGDGINEGEDNNGKPKEKSFSNRPNGLEKIEPSVIKDIFTQLIKERESKRSTSYFFPTNKSFNSVVNRYGIECKITR